MYILVVMVQVRVRKLPARSVLPLRLGSGAYGLSVLEQPHATFPDQRSDFKLKDVDLWKASRSAVAHPPPRSASQASELAAADVVNSYQKVHVWIKTRKQSSGNWIQFLEPLEKHFPDRLQWPLGKWVDIVVVTPESACGCAYSVDPINRL